MGLIAPVTIVGATVFHTVDVLAGITMAQVIRPGAPVLFGGAPATFHMKIASSPMAAIEALQLDVAYVAVAKSLGPADPVVHGPVGRADPRRPGRRRDVRQRAARGARRASTPCPAPGCSTSCSSSACRSSSSTTRCAARRSASCATIRPLDDLPVDGAHRPADGRPAPDHGRTRPPTGRPSSTCRARSSTATTARTG